MLTEQIVPSSACAVCEVCCRFADVDSPLRPYFTREEIEAAIASGVSPDAFPDHAGSKIRLVPSGDGYKCPAFDTATRQCTIYRSRPLDCQLYPLTVMWDKADEQVVLGWDTKCPFIVQKVEMKESLDYAQRTAERLETTALANTFAAHSQLVGAFQDDVIVLRPLERITRELRVSRTVHPLTLRDRARFESLVRAYACASDPLAAYAFPYHFIWREHFSYQWFELEGHVCLIATNEVGSFLALPPLGPDPGAVMARIFVYLETRNRIPEVSRIENVPETLAEYCRTQGYTVSPKAAEYVYRREDLIGLKGDRYKSQRASYNQCLKQASPSIRTYHEEDLTNCMNLFEQWRTGVKSASDGYADHMAADAGSAHRLALTHASDLGLTGIVAHIGARLVGYTLGYPLSASVFCVLLEITDRRVTGLSSYIFREFTKRLPEYEFINAMDDSGLEGLRRAKESYHPIRLLQSYTVAPAKVSRPGSMPSGIT